MIIFLIKKCYLLLYHIVWALVKSRSVDVLICGCHVRVNARVMDIVLRSGLGLWTGLVLGIGAVFFSQLFDFSLLLVLV